MSRTLLATLVICVLLPASAGAAVLDPGFGDRGIVATLAPAGVDRPGLNGVSIDPSRRVIVTGTGTVNGTTATWVMRLGTGGAADTGFSDDGTATLPLFPYAVASGADGSTLVGGVVVNTSRGQIARLTPDGRLDPAFGQNGYLDTAGPARAFAVASSGAVDALVSGGVLQLNAAGKPDAAFGSAGFAKVSGASTAVAIARGSSGSVTVLTSTGAVRLTKTGARDRRFGTVKLKLPARSKLIAVAVDGSDRAIVAGAVPSGNHYKSYVVRLTPAGRVDKTFGGGKPVIVAASGGLLPEALAVTRSGVATVAAGWASLLRPAAFRLTAKGRLDTSFGHRGLALSNDQRPFEARMAAAPAPGRIAFAGFTGQALSAARLAASPK